MGEIASPGQLWLSFVRWALVTVPLVLLLGLLSAMLSGSGGESAWFAALNKPAIMPPDAAFGIVWPVLYVLEGLAIAVILHARGAKGRGLAVGAFVVQFVATLAWSPLFFAAHKIGPAFWLIIGCVILAGITIVLFSRVRKSAALLLMPYLAWLIFAAVLNLQFDRLNPEAESLAPGAADAQIAL